MTKKCKTKHAGGGLIKAVKALAKAVNPRSELFADILGRDHPLYEAVRTAEVPEHVIAREYGFNSAQPEPSLYEPAVARRWEDQEGFLQPGVAHYDASGGAAIPDIIVGRRAYYDGDFIPDELDDLPLNDPRYVNWIVDQMAPQLAQGRVRESRLDRIPPESVKYVPEDPFIVGEPPELDGKFMFYINEAEGSPPDLSGIPSVLSPRDILNDPALRRELNMSLAVPAESDFYRRPDRRYADGGEVKASPQSPVLGALARHLRAARSLGDEARIPLIDMGLGELLLGKAPEEIEEWSYGNLPFQRGRGGIGSRVPQLKRGRAEGFMDATMGALDAAGIGALARRGLAGAVGSAGTRFGANPIPQIGAIKPRGGNWIPGDVESSISNLFERLGETDPQRLAALREQMGNPELGRSGEALGSWIEGPLTKYIKRDMATPEDPVRRLADEGILHMGIPQTAGVPSTYIRNLRVDAGFPQEGLSETPGGSLWENLSDRVVSSGQAKYLQEEPKMMAENPWMQKLDPESTVYGMKSSIERGLGFDHLVDELGNAMNPESGLPRNLLLRPEQMQQMGMEKAVRHVDAINKWRAAQEAQANAELANKAMVLREYPDVPEMPNPKGLRWMELSPDEELAKMYKEGIPSGAENAQRYKEKLSALEKQLKYEGDTMGHCVGGYCPDVLKGRSRIFSLRDAKGEPHVTVEVKPKIGFDAFDTAEDEARDILGSFDHPDFERLRDEIYDGMMSKDELLITQIKGSGKKDPGQRLRLKENDYEDEPDAYLLPFVQDFVRNNPLGASGWSNVGDLYNTRLRKVGDKYVTLEELKDVPKTADGLPIGYQPFDDLPDWKDGGLVDGGIDDPVQFALQWRELVDAENGYRRA